MRVPASILYFIHQFSGPGAFSQLLLTRRFKGGFGITLKTDDSSTSWYEQLLNLPEFKVLWGPLNNGDVYVPQNLDAVFNELKDETVSIVVGDGGFKITKLDGKHMENLQESFSGRIILSEVLLALRTLSEGGSFVIKLFDSFSWLTSSLIYITSKLCDECIIVKPLRSRIVNSERYLVGKFLKERNAQYVQLFTTMTEMHAKLHAEVTQIQQSPISLVPLDVMKDDKDFMDDMIHMVEELARKQTDALRVVMDEVEREVAEIPRNRH